MEQVISILRKMNDRSKKVFDLNNNNCSFVGRYRILLLIEVIIGILSLTYLFLFDSDEHQNVIPVSVQSWESKIINYNNGWHVEPNQVDIVKGPIDLIYGPYIKLEKGNYSIDINYECDCNQIAKPYANEGNDVFLESSEFYLDKNLQNETYTFLVKEDIENFELQVKYNGVGALSIYDISIYKNDSLASTILLWIIACIVISNYVLFFRCLTIEKKRYHIGIIFVVFVTSIPLLFRGLNGHDLVFHLMRIEGLVNELKNGFFPVRIESTWLSGYGYPVSIYYGDILLYFPAILRYLGVNINAAYKIFVTVVNLFTAIIAALCFGKISKQKKIGLVCSMVYCMAPYRLVNLYIRAAVGEYCAMMFFPLVAYAMWKILCEQSDINKTFKQIFIDASVLAIGLSGIITSHILSSEMAALTILLVIVLCPQKAITRQCIMTYVVAAIECISLCAFFIVPFLDYYLNVNVIVLENAKKGVSYKIQNNGIEIADYFAFFSNPFGQSGDLLETPGIILVGTLCVSMVLYYLKKLSNEYRVLIRLALITMFMSLNIFPWDRLAYKFKVFNILAQVQFPWRWLGITICILTMILGLILSENQNKIVEIIGMNTKRLLYVCSVITVVMTLVFMSFFADYSECNLFYDTHNLDTANVGGGRISSGII